MDWIMDLPPEVITAFWIGIATVIAATFAFIGTVIIAARYSIREFTKLKIRQESLEQEQAEAKVKNEQREAEADTKREEIINTFVVDWNKRLESQQTKLNDYGEKIIQLREANAELRGKITVLTDSHNLERDTWNRQRAELLEKIDKLEKRIVELEHERVSNLELINQLRQERDELKKQLEERDKKIIALQIGWNETKEQLEDCQDEQKKETKLSVQPKPQPTQENPKKRNSDKQGKDAVA